MLIKCFKLLIITLIMICIIIQKGVSLIHESKKASIQAISSTPVDGISTYI
jgi:hypothetical protein